MIWVEVGLEESIHGNQMAKVTIWPNIGMNASTFEQDEGVMLMSSNAQAYKSMLVSNVMQVNTSMLTNISRQVVMLLEIMSLTNIVHHQAFT